MSRLDAFLGLEDQQVAEKAPETELVVYARITHPEGLQGASAKELQVQLEGQYSNGVRCRVRETVRDQVTTYVYTFKIKTSSPGEIRSGDEYNTEVNLQFFEGFAKVASHRLVKTRHIFDQQTVRVQFDDGQQPSVVTVPNMVFEVDQFQNAEGTVCEWCKIDIELDALYAYLKEHQPGRGTGKILVKVDHLPFRPEGCFLDNDATPQQHTMIQKVWADQFRQAISA